LRRIGPLLSALDGVLDCPGNRRRQRGQDGLVALAANLQDPVAVFLAEVGDVRAAGFEDPQPEQVVHRRSGRSRCGWPTVARWVVMANWRSRAARPLWPARHRSRRRTKRRRQSPLKPEPARVFGTSAERHSPGRNLPRRTLSGMKKMLLTAASVAAALTLALSGCSNDKDQGTGGDAVSKGGAGPSGDADPFTKVIKYAECLQRNGLAVKIKPDDGFSLPKGYDPKVKEAAEAACRNVAPPGMYEKPSAEELDRYVKIAQCLRDQGIKVKDPTADRPQLEIDQTPPANLKQLQEACEARFGGS
jgi:hypothetical protein